MADLFSPLVIAGTVLPNRLVMAPATSGLATPDGFVSDALHDYYAERARGGVGMIVSEAMLVVPPADPAAPAHLGLYADAFVPALHRMVHAVQAAGTRMVLTLDAPATAATAPIHELIAVGDQFVVAAWRALAAGADGVMFTAADGGLLHSLFSPLSNQRDDAYGGSIDGRLRLAQELLEAIKNWLGRRLLLGFRLVAEEVAPGGISLPDARVVARRLVSAGVRLFDVTVLAGDQTPLATFPGWCVPLANSIKRVTPEAPVICAGQLDEPFLADSVIRDGSVDLVMIDAPLRDDPAWPARIRELLAREEIP